MLSDPDLVLLDTNPRTGEFSPRLRRYLRAKRVMDITGAILLGLAVLPLVGILAVLVRLDGGSAFFCQKRLGQGGEVFHFWKLRTMASDAEGALSRYLAENPEARLEWEHTQKLRKDPRITWLGQFMRKYTFDELPQLWNVLRGDMSLIGPRPMFVEQRSLYPGVIYGNMKPGITGLWQVMARNQSAFADRAAFDHAYARTVSLRTDLFITLRTIRAVFLGTGL